MKIITLPLSPLPSREGKLLVFPLPLWERVRVRGDFQVKRRILIIDDHDTQRRILREFLELLRHEVVGEGSNGKELPVAVSAPEWMDEKSLADGLFSVALGLFTHVSPQLPVTGSKVLSRFLTHKESKRKHLRPEPPTILDLTGGEFAIEPDPVRAANLIEYHISKRRERLF